MRHYYRILKTCLNSRWSMFYLASFKSKMECRMILKFSTREGNEPLTKTVSGVFLLSLYFFNYQMFFQKWTSANTFLPIFSNNKLEKEFWHRSVEILGKIMDPQKKFRINKTFESWSSQEITFSDIFASYFLLKRDSLKLFFKKANVITITAQKNEVFH